MYFTQRNSKKALVHPVVCSPVSVPQKVVVRLAASPKKWWFTRKYPPKKWWFPHYFPFEATPHPRHPAARGAVGRSPLCWALRASAGTSSSSRKDRRPSSSSQGRSSRKFQEFLEGCPWFGFGESDHFFPHFSRLGLSRGLIKIPSRAPPVLTMDNLSISRSKSHPFLLVFASYPRIQARFSGLHVFRSPKSDSHETHQKQAKRAQEMPGSHQVPPWLEMALGLAKAAGKASKRQSANAGH